MKATQIVIGDSQYLVREGIKLILSKRNDIILTGEASNEVELLNQVQQKRPDVVLLDYDQRGHFSTSTVSLIKDADPSTNILIVSADNRKQNIYHVLENGVNSFLTKQCDEEEIISAIKATAKGEKFFCKKVVDYIFERSFPKQDDCSPSRLTRREVEIVKLISSGKIAKEIADELNISTHTVYTHRKNIMKKLELTSTSELILYAVKTGIISYT